MSTFEEKWQEFKNNLTRLVPDWNTQFLNWANARGYGFSGGFFNEFPHTHTYETDLSWLISRMKWVLFRMDSVEERMAAVEKLLTEFIETLDIPNIIRQKVLNTLREMIEAGEFDDTFRRLVDVKFNETELYRIVPETVPVNESMKEVVYINISLLGALVNFNAKIRFACLPNNSSSRSIQSPLLNGSTAAINGRTGERIEEFNEFLKQRYANIGPYDAGQIALNSAYISVVGFNKTELQAVSEARFALDIRVGESFFYVTCQSVGMDPTIFNLTGMFLLPQPEALTP